MPSRRSPGSPAGGGGQPPRPGVALAPGRLGTLMRLGGRAGDGPPGPGQRAGHVVDVALGGVDVEDERRSGEFRTALADVPAVLVQDMLPSLAEQRCEVLHPASSGPMQRTILTGSRPARTRRARLAGQANVWPRPIGSRPNSP